jgi:hypothetical protein
VNASNSGIVAEFAISSHGGTTSKVWGGVWKVQLYRGRNTVQKISDSTTFMYLYQMKF